EREIAALVELLLLETRPLPVYFAATNVPANHEQRAGVTVIGAAIAVLAGHASKLGHRENHDVVHPVAEVSDQRRDRAGEIVETLGELAGGRSLIHVRVPAADVCERDLESDIRLDQLRDLQQPHTEL